MIGSGYDFFAALNRRTIDDSLPSLSFLSTSMVRMFRDSFAIGFFDM